VPINIGSLIGRHRWFLYLHFSCGTSNTFRNLSHNLLGEQNLINYCLHTSEKSLLVHHVWKEGCNQECRYVWGHAAGCCGLCNSSPREIQHWERHCCLHQERVWQEVQPNMALHCRTQLWQLCYPWNETFHLFLLGTSGHIAFQIWINGFDHSSIKDSIMFLHTPHWSLLLSQMFYLFFFVISLRSKTIKWYCLYTILCGLSQMFILFCFFYDLFIFKQVTVMFEE